MKLAQRAQIIIARADREEMLGLAHELVRRNEGDRNSAIAVLKWLGMPRTEATRAVRAADWNAAALGRWFEFEGVVFELADGSDTAWFQRSAELEPTETRRVTLWDAQAWRAAGNRHPEPIGHVEDASSCRLETRSDSVRVRAARFVIAVAQGAGGRPIHGASAAPDTAMDTPDTVICAKAAQQGG